MAEKSPSTRDYSNELDIYWASILRAWDEHGDKHPIIECDLEKQQVGAYPAREYIARLSTRTRRETQRLYDRTVRDGSMMVFVRDSDNRDSLVKTPATGVPKIPVFRKLGRGQIRDFSSIVL